jgi:hypothetical protein
LPVPGSQRKQATFQLDLGSPHPTADYLDALDLKHLHSGGQTCYLFPTTVGDLVIPAQLLVNAVLAPTTLLRGALLSPHGPRALVTVFVDDTGLRAERTPSRMREFHEQRRGAAARVEWVQTYPSASRAWSSVYARALGGRLDLALPAATAVASFAGIEKAGRLYVATLTFKELTPTEERHKFALGQTPVFCRVPQTMQMASGELDAHDVQSPPTANPTIAPMSDEHWVEVRAAFDDLGRRWRASCIHSYRDRFDLVRAHLATG